MEKVKRMKCVTSFNCLPNEILLMIFDYLTPNDIIYTFFFLTQRSNHLLLQSQSFFNYLKLPTTDLDTWEIILSIIGPQIKCLNITTTHLFFPLRYFLNLKSLIISSLYGLSVDKWKYIIEHDLFKTLSSLKIKQEKIFSNPYLPDNCICEDKIFEKVFNENSSLEIFEYPLMISSPIFYTNTDHFQINSHLHSLTIALLSFGTIFLVLQYTPNLKYLNAKARLPFGGEEPLDQTNVKLERLHLTLNKPNEYARIDL